MKPADRDAEMARFRDGELDVLVGTTVIEVGVDVAGGDDDGRSRAPTGSGSPSSTSSAAGSGAAPPRASASSSRTTTDETAQARLKAVTEIRDGFELAEKDFELRREGDVLGLAQSGLPRLRVASLQNREHVALAKRAREHAEALLDDAGRLRPGRGAAPPRARARLARPGLGRRAGASGGVTRDGRRGTGDRGLGEGHPAPRARARDAAARRPRQADAVRDPRAGARRRPRPRPVRRQRRRRDRGAVARRGQRRRSSRRTRAPPPSSTPTSGRPRSPGPPRRSSAGTSSAGWPRPNAAPAVRPRPRRPALRRDRARWRASSTMLGAPTTRRSRRMPASSPSTSGATGRPSGSVCWPPSATGGSARRR